MTKSSYVVGCGLILGILVIGYGLGSLMMGVPWANLDPNVLASLIAATTAVLTVILTQWQHKKRGILESHRPQKVDVYLRFMKFIFDVLHKSKTGELEEIDPENPPADLEETFFDFTRDQIIWASPGVISATERFRTSAARGETLEILMLVDDILRAIRKDLGNSNRGLKRGDLIKTVLRDPEELDRTVTGQ